MAKKRNRSASVEGESPQYRLLQHFATSRVPVSEDYFAQLAGVDAKEAGQMFRDAVAWRWFERLASKTGCGGQYQGRL